MTTLEAIAIRFRWILLGGLAAAAAISLLVGLKGALTSSKDFQWAGSYLLRAGVDPWQAVLTNNVSQVAHLSPPNYLHELYILLMPISMLSYHHATFFWFCLNILLSIAVIYLLKNRFSLSQTTASTILLIFWMSTPFRTTLQVGQMSVLELFLLCIVFCTSNSTLRGVALGLSFSKYSFAPVVVSLLWFKRNLRTLAIAAVVPLLGLLMAWGMLGGSLFKLASEPFAVSSIRVWPGMADLMTCVEGALAHWLPGFSGGRLLAYGLGLLLSCVYGFYVSRRRITEGAQFALIAVASLFAIKHLMYDYIFLIVPLCYAASPLGRPIRQVVFPIIGVFWFMDKLFPLLPLNVAPNTSQWLTIAAATCLLGTLVIYLTWAIPRIERTYFARLGRIEREAIRIPVMTSAA